MLWGQPLLLRMYLSGSTKASTHTPSPSLQVAAGIAAQAEQWKQDYGEVLAHASKAKLERVMAKINQWQVCVWLLFDG
jgi:hypothetical protein